MIIICSCNLFATSLKNLKALLLKALSFVLCKNLKLSSKSNGNSIVGFTIARQQIKIAVLTKSLNPPPLPLSISYNSPFSSIKVEIDVLAPSGFYCNFNLRLGF